MIKLIAEKDAAIADEKKNVAYAEVNLLFLNVYSHKPHYNQRFQQKATALITNENRSHSQKRFLRRYNATQVIAARSAQHQDNLQKLQVVSLVKNAIAEDEGVRSALFASISKQLPDKPNAIDIFQRQLNDITSCDPDGIPIQSFSDQVLDYLKMGDYGIGEEDEMEVDQLEE